MTKTKDLVKKDDPNLSDKQVSSTVKQLLNKSMSKGKVKAIKLKVKMK